MTLQLLDVFNRDVQKEANQPKNDDQPEEPVEGDLNFFLIIIYLASHKYMFFQPLRHMKYFIKIILSTNAFVLSIILMVMIMMVIMKWCLNN